MTEERSFVEYIKEPKTTRKFRWILLDKHLKKKSQSSNTLTIEKSLQSIVFLSRRIERRSVSVVRHF